MANANATAVKTYKPKRCAKCSKAFTPRSGRQIFCSEPCGLGEQHRKVIKTCDCCGSQCLKEPSAGIRYGGVYCSILCRDYSQWGPLSRALPAQHWAYWYEATSQWTPPIIRNTGECAWCGGENLRGASAAYCAEQCKKKAHKARRRAIEHNAPGEYAFSQVMRQYQRQGLVCAYCAHPCNGLPDPEHVVPLSRGGRNDMSNIVASCRPCNSDKRDLLLGEWNEDRKRRGLEPVNTQLEERSEFFHLAA